MYKGTTRFIGRTMLLLVVCSLMIVAISGCQAAQTKSDRQSKDWSRGLKVGTASINNKVAMTSDAEGDNVYLAWVESTEGELTQSIHYAHLSPSAEILAQTTLAIGTDLPSDVTLAVDNRDSIHLTWIDRLNGERRLFYAMLGSNGQLSQYPRPISLAGHSVSDHTMAISQDDQLDVFWSSEEGLEPGVYHLNMDLIGHVTKDNQLIIAGGLNIAFAADRSGQIHMAFQTKPTHGRRTLYYALFNRESHSLTGTTQLVEFPVPTGVVGHKPVLAIGREDIYIFWSTEIRGGGLTRPSATTSYLAFPLGSPEMAGAPRQVLVSGNKYPELYTVRSDYNVTQLAPPMTQGFPSTFVYLPAAVANHQGELATAFAIQIEGQTHSVIQIALVLWENGEIKGYQIIGDSQGSSLRPVMTVDQAHDLHLAWIDTAGFGSYDVYYASTSSQARQSLNRITLDDVFNFGADVMWATISALGFIPLAFMWLALPIMILAVYMFIRAESGLDRTGPRIMLVIGMFIYLMFKYISGTYWMGVFELPIFGPALVTALTWGAPLAMAGIAALLTWFFVHRKGYASLLPAFLFFAAMDTLLTLLVYIPGLMID